MKFIKFLFLWVLGAGLLETPSLFGYIQPPPGGYGLQAEFLYLFPSYDNTFFVIRSNNDTPADFIEGERKHNRFGFKAAFRIEAVFGLCNSHFDGRVRWAHLDGKRHRKVFGEFLLGTEGWPGESDVFSGLADSGIAILYNNIEVLFGHPVVLCQPFELFLRGGIQYGYVRYTEEILYEVTGADNNEIRFRGRFWGIGPELAIETHCELIRIPCWCPNALTLILYGSGSLLVSESKAEFLRRVGSTSHINVKDEKMWRIVPSWNLRLGLNYSLCVGCAKLSAEVGYDVTSFIRGATKLRFIESTTPGLSFNDFTNFDVHGPYANLGLVF